NAQSRTIEDALMREGITYKVVGGVRFYERKEIKDALAYMRLVINPHDDVSLRRVINVPARGIGKGVMESVENIGPATALDEALPLLAAGLQPAVSANSLWARLVRGLEDRRLTGRAAASLAVFRDLIVQLTDMARRPGGARGRMAPALAVERRRRGARGRTAALLRRHDARAVAARADRCCATADLRRVPVERTVAFHRRSSGGACRASRGFLFVV